MKWSLWSLLLLCLCTPGRSDCQGDCLACGLLLSNPQSQQQAFNTLVCLLECDGHISPALTWDLCQRAMLPQYPLPTDDSAVSKRPEEKLSLNLAPADLESDGKMLYSAAMERYQQDGAEQEDEALVRRDAQYDSSPLGLTAEGDSLALGMENGEEEEKEEEVRRRRSGQGEGGDEEEDAVVQLTKRFGGFLKGRHSYRKLIGSPVRKSLQKRLGGFIGIRKSARKWNNQKRVSQLLRQYLGMTSSSTPGRGGGRFTNPAQGLRRLPSRL
ncbi:prepronociceptin-like [Salmo trutta]|uniref:Prepronociceptin b n=1 Tax=Salmo trutta TaxID=8032 RepID=A0A674AX49_SALTR|nr:prepronociceptin-like [Salmo trutta]XP_029590228.1 prepronociceptin-like [Salmo trutta]